MKQGVPVRGELVVCRITKLHPNSAFAQLLEYGRPGMIHVSEVAGRWVRDIREFVREDQFVVCRVIGVEGETISLSIKQVRREEATRKLNEYKRESKSEKILEQAAKSLNKTLEQAYKEVGFSLQEEFGSLTKAIEVSVKNPSLFRKKSVPPAWVAAISEVAQKKFVEKTYEVRGNLELLSYAPNGVEIIRRALASAQKKGFEVKYIAAPNYLLRGKGKDIKKLRSSLEEEAEALIRSVKQSGGEGKFEIKE